MKKEEDFLCSNDYAPISKRRSATIPPRATNSKFCSPIRVCTRFRGTVGRIFPAAKIEGGVFIDHGTGVVIGETAEVKSGVVIYQGVTLGGTGKEKGKRHPTIEKDVIISAGAKVLGGFTVGEGAKIGAGAVVLKEVPPHATVVGVPGRVVRIRGEKPDLLQEKTDPNAEEIRALKCRIHKLEAALEKLTGEKFECTKEELFPVPAEGEKDEENASEENGNE